MRRLLLRLLNVFRRDSVSGDLDRELASHLALLEDEYRRRGMTPDEARLAARRAMGSVALTKDRHRDARSFGWLEDLRQDVRHSLRSLARTPAFTIAAVVTLALGIGASTTIFSVVNGVLLRPAPYEQADRLVRVVAVLPAAAPWLPSRRLPVPLTAAWIADLRQSARSLSDVGTVQMTLMNLRGRDPRLQGAAVSARFFELLGAKPMFGRLLAPADEAPGAEPVVLLSAETWRRHFNSDPDVVGRVATFDAVLGAPVRTDYVVIGVMPDGFAFPSGETRAWTAPQLTPVAGRASPAAAVLARLADGVSREAAEAEVAPIVRRLRADIDQPDVGYELATEQDELVRPVRPALLVLSGAVIFVLLLACVNVANLLLARTVGRQRELIIRGALGAARARLVRHLLTESVTLGLIGGIAGVVLAFGAVRLLRGLVPALMRLDIRSQAPLPRLGEIEIDLVVLGFTIAVSMVTGVVFGLVPALRHARPDGANTFNGQSAVTPIRLAFVRRFEARAVLVAVEVAMAMVLLAGGGLLMRGLIGLLSVDVGYDAANVLTFQVALPVDLYRPARQRMFADDVVTGIRSLPGVERAAYANQLPMVGLTFTFSFRRTPFVEAPRGGPGAPMPGYDLRLVSQDYLDVMRVPLVRGRGFTDGDGPGRLRVMLINEALARSEFAGEDPLGVTVFLGRRPEPWQIVGVVGNVRQFGPDFEAQPQFFIDLRQWTDDGLVFPGGAYYAVRTRGEPAAIVPDIRRIVRQFDPQAVLFYEAPMAQVVASTLTRPRLYVALLGLFAAIGVGLAVIGIYGLMTYTVVQRTREIGIRMALGARSREVVSLIVGQGAILTIAGVAGGLAGAAFLSRFLEGLLFGLDPLDAGTYIAASMIFLTVALLAAFLPARRATQIDPLRALRTE